MAAHFSILAWKIPWTAEPGRLPSMGSQRVGHNLATEQQQQLAPIKNLPSSVGDTRDMGGKDPLDLYKMATCFSILAWKISWTEEPGQLQSMGSQRVGHD